MRHWILSVALKAVTALLRACIAVHEALDAAQWSLQRARTDAYARQLWLAGGSSEQFESVFVRKGSHFPPMTLEHGVTHAKLHDAFELNPAIDAKRLSYAEQYAIEAVLGVEREPHGKRIRMPNEGDLAAFRAAEAEESAALEAAALSAED